MNAPHSAMTSARASTRVWTELGVVSAVMLLAFISRLNFTVVLALPDFIQTYGLSDQQRGFLSSAFDISYSLLMLPAGFVVDRYGSKYPLAVGFLLWCLVSAAMYFTTSVQQIFVLRLLLGVCESVVTPASMRWIRF